MAPGGEFVPEVSMKENPHRRHQALEGNVDSTPRRVLRPYMGEIEA